MGVSAGRSPWAGAGSGSSGRGCARDGGGEAPVPAYERFSRSEVLGRMAMDKMLGGPSSRRYRVGLEPGQAHTCHVDYEVAFDALKDVFLEDSWVLEVLPSTHELALRLDVVLDAKHPLYEAPPFDEQYCSRTAWLVLMSDRPIDIELLESSALTVGTSQVFCSIEGFAIDPDTQHCVVHGTWGRAVAWNPHVTLRFDGT